MMIDMALPQTEGIYTPRPILNMGLRMVEKSDKLLMRGGADLSSVIPNSFDKKARPSPKKFKDVNKEKLKRLYLDEKLSCAEIGEIYSVHLATIRNWLIKHDIPIRDASIKINIKKEDLDWLYLHEKKSMIEIAEVYGCSHWVISHRLEKFGIKKRGREESLKLRLDRKMENVPSHELYYLYHQQKLTIKEIGEMYGMSIIQIWERMRRYNIPRMKGGFKKGHTPWHKGKTGVYSEETLKEMSEASKGRTSGMKGKHHSEEVKRRLSEAHKGHTAWNKGLSIEDDRVGKGVEALTKAIRKQYEDGREPWNKGKKVPQMAGENSPHWKGGHDDYRGEDWLYQRRLARQRDKGICYICHDDERNHSKKFAIHHIVPYRIGRDNSLKNLMTLCGKCHPRIDKITDDN